MEDPYYSSFVCTLWSGLYLRRTYLSRDKWRAFFNSIPYHRYIFIITDSKWTSLENSAFAGSGYSMCTYHSKLGF